ncbi:MAG TPA: hypothetical protein VFI06_03710 [Chitinophagaceae bacterium]|nr:hypothetical protein [Chitinophagaceae bacterium]
MEPKRKVLTQIPGISLVFLAGAFVLLLSCKKEKINSPREKSFAELLTQKEWILAGYGFDDNGNGKLDAAENLIQDCEKDNSYRFNAPDIGTTRDNALSCGGPGETQFSWQLLNNNTQLEIESNPFSILLLNENSMELNHPLLTKLIITYTH